MNTNALKAKVIEKGHTLKWLSEQTGIKKTALYRKLAGITEFTRKEIEAIADALELKESEICYIFFTKKVS